MDNLFLLRGVIDLAYMDNINVGIFSKKLLIELIIFICLALLKPLELEIIFLSGIKLLYTGHLLC